MNLKITYNMVALFTLYNIYTEQHVVQLKQFSTKAHIWSVTYTNSNITLSADVGGELGVPAGWEEDVQTLRSLAMPIYSI